MPDQIIGDIREDINKDVNKDIKEKVEDVDYAILKTMIYVNSLNLKEIEDEIREVANILQIRVIIIEKRIYRMVKNGLMKFNGHCILTQKGKDVIGKFEQDSKEWRSIDNFIISSMKDKKERNLKTRNIVDKSLLIVIIMLIIFLIYVTMTY